MQKAGLAIVVSGALIVIGLVLLVAGSQAVLEGVSQGGGKVSAGQELEVTGYFEEQVRTGVFAVQIMEFRENTFSARVLDPFGVEVASERIDRESFERDFDVFEAGEYMLVVQSSSPEEAQVFGAVGPLPDAGKKSLGAIAIYVLVVGMLGLAGIGIFSIRNKIRSV